MRILRLLLELATVHIAGRGRQTVVSVAGVVLGVGFSIGMAALLQGSQDDFVSQLIDAMPHVQITDEARNPPRQPAETVFDAAAISGLRPREDPRGILNPVAAVAALEAFVEGHIAVTLNVQGVVRHGGREEGISIAGIDPFREGEVSQVAGQMVEGRLEELAAIANGIIIGKALADKLDAGVGSTVTLVSPRGLNRRYRIIGLFRTGNTSVDENRIYMSLRSARVFANRPNALNEIRIRLDDPDRAPTVAARAEALLGLKSVPWQEANESILEAFAVRNTIMYTVVAAILLVAGFGIFNIVSTITHEKARDIAILKSLGFRAADMRRLFVIEGLAMGFVGALGGFMLGYGLTLALGQVAIKVPGTDTMRNLPVVVDPLHYTIAATIAMLSAAIAGYLPSRKAAALNPVDIIRGAT